MTRRDTIIIATLVNLVLLATLFVTATREERDDSHSPPPLVEEDSLTSPEKKDEFVALNSSDDARAPDVDEALKEVLENGENTPGDNGLALSEEGIDKELLMLATEEPPPAIPDIPAPEKPKPSSNKEENKTGNTIEIKVKRGDALEKLARSYGTTIKEIKSLNRLETDSLKIGQTLRIPQNNARESKETALADYPQKNSSKELWVTVKSGDSPWKIAKQYNVRYEDILKLNNMTEEKAKNLKIGDKIRIK